MSTRIIVYFLDAGIIIRESLLVNILTACYFYFHDVILQLYLSLTLQKHHRAFLHSFFVSTLHQNPSIDPNDKFTLTLYFLMVITCLFHLKKFLFIVRTHFIHR